MNPPDYARFQQAIALAQTGQRQAAYLQFVALVRTNPGYVPLLLWIAYTTPDLMEARRAIDQAKTLEPENPNIASAEDYWFNWYSQSSPGVASGYGAPQYPPSKSKIPVWVKAVGVAILIQLVVAFLTVAVLVAFGPQIQSVAYNASVKSTPTTCCSGYVSYSDPDTMRRQAPIGSLAKFKATSLQPAQFNDANYDYYLWQTKTGLNQGTGVIVEFPKEKGQGLKPAKGSATYYVKITSRLANTTAQDAYLYVEVLEVQPD